jgi:ubiquitin C-terminal hydrolase
MDNTVRIRELSIIGATTTLFDLSRKQDNQELVMLFLKRMHQEALSEAVIIKEVGKGNPYLFECLENRTSPSRVFRN